MFSSSSASNQVATYELRTSARLNREETATEFIEIRCSEGNGQQEGYGSAEVCLHTHIPTRYSYSYSSSSIPILFPLHCKLIYTSKCNL